MTSTLFKFSVGDLVRIASDYPHLGLHIGQIGTVVAVNSYEVCLSTEKYTSKPHKMGIEYMYDVFIPANQELFRMDDTFNIEHVRLISESR
jgi:hypothetical protein